MELRSRGTDMRPGASAGPDGTTVVLIDPWLSGPTFPAALLEALAADVLALTHGHGDHTGEIVEVAKRLGVPVLAPTELARRARRARASRTPSGFNKGGTVEAGGIRFTMTNASTRGAITIDGQVGRLLRAGRLRDHVRERHARVRRRRHGDPSPT